MRLRKLGKVFAATAIALGACAGLGLGLTTRGACAAAPGKPADVKKMQDALPGEAPVKPAKARKVLVYGLANGFVHTSIGLGQQTIAEMGQKTGAYTSVVTDDPAMFDADKLAEFDAIVLVSTTSNFMVPRVNVPGDPKKMTEEQKKEFDAKRKEAEAKLQPHRDAEKQRLANLVEFVRGGKGLMGIHAATDAYYNSKDYGDVIGGFFSGHPWNEKVYLKFDDANSPLTSMFEKGQSFAVADEIYQFTSKGKDKDGTEKQPYSRNKVRVLLSLDMSEGKTAIKKDTAATVDYPVSWVREAGKGRVFYCSLGHREEIFWNTAVLKHYLAGIQYATGDLKANATPSAAGTASAPPAELLRPVAATK